ncbi:sphingosine kinase [Vigna unguiculata]|uniref:Sphingosine kinase n=1 Tax=Vigna unguiculata TaxID=3917 RepID=A0A4D6MFQ2_VIGUN|nr:sphingosine kinase [Vigna unguiculata]
MDCFGTMTGVCNKDTPWSSSWKGMAESILDSVGNCTTTNVVLAIIRGHKRSLDMATITQGETRFFSVLMLA